MATHRLEANRRTLHGHFSIGLEPVLTIDPGDRVSFQTLPAGWYTRALDPGLPEDRQVRFEPRHPELDAGHALTGPVRIRGARPGSMLSVRVERLQPGIWGWTAMGGRPGPANRFLDVVNVRELLTWRIDPKAGIAVNQHGHRVRTRPFLGVMGVAPAEPGVHSTFPPRSMGGNLDCRELVEGSVLHLPVAVEGALFSTGDGHGAQGDGEVSGTAIECPMEEALLGFEIDSDPPIETIWAETPAGEVTFGFSEDLDEACHRALEAMVTLIQVRYDMSRLVALGMASVVCDMRITQIVNGVLGVHAVLPPGAIESGRAG